MKKWKRWAPAVMILFSVLLNIIGRMWKGFSNFYVNHVFPVWVETYGRITGFFPFSVGEWMLYLAVLLVFALAVGGILLIVMRRRLLEGWKRAYKRYAFFIYWVFGIVCIIMTLNCFLLYQASPINERFEIGGSRDREYGVKEIAALRDYVVVQANELAPTFGRDAQGYLLYQKDMEKEAVRQMQRLGDRFENLKGYYPEPKKLFLSEFYSQQYIMGYYFPFSMEANYNRQMYVTNMPVTMCHELSHLKGFILEDEANFIGYLACVDAEDPMFRYSAYLSVIGYLDRDFIKAIDEDPEIYLEHPQISQQVAVDKMFLTNEAWEQVEKKAVLSTETVKQAADTFLDTTLTLNGVADGTVSYSRVVKLLLQYYDGILY
ncbi:MAG: DUF3810 domain-containing protein [Lachnospiraceae bacterium]|nr:DUF3810 domain-containing protein [Lachnospiraceae bacterium]MDE6184668.1 DUF3810 domain-containing protein [Lachnospiraceae bacterium]